MGIVTIDPEWDAGLAEIMTGMSSWNDPMSLRFSASDSPDHENDGRISNAISTEFAVDFYRISLRSDAEYSFKTVADMTAPISIYNDSGYPLAVTRERLGTEYVVQPFTPPSTGSYMVGVTLRDLPVGAVRYTLTAEEDIGADGLNSNLPTNRTPTARAIASQTATEGRSYRLTVPANTFTDPDGDSLTYSSSLSNGRALPSWLRFNARTRTFAATSVPRGAVDLSIRITARDPEGESARTTFALRTPASSVKRAADEMVRAMIGASAPLSGSASLAPAGGGQGLAGMLAA